MASKMKKTGTKVGTKSTVQPTVKNLPSTTLETTGSRPDTPGVIPEDDAITRIVATSESEHSTSEREEPTKGRKPQATSALFTESPNGSDEFTTQKPIGRLNYEWTTVPKTPKRAHSLDSAKTSRISNNNKFDILATNPFTTGNTGEPELETGTSVSKGKHIDPREWGDVELNDEEVDIDAQEVALKAYKKALVRETKKNKKNKKKYAKNEHKSTSGNDLDIPKVNKHQNVPKEEHRAGSRPVAQIAPESSLGVALTGVANRFKSQSGQTNIGKEDPSSPSSSSDSDDSSSPTSDSGQSRQKRRGRKLEKNRRKPVRKTIPEGDNFIKPIPPKEYDGSADPTAYH